MQRLWKLRDERRHFGTSRGALTHAAASEGDVSQRAECLNRDCCFLVLSFLLSHGEKLVLRFNGGKVCWHTQNISEGRIGAPAERKVGPEGCALLTPSGS